MKPNKMQPHARRGKFGLVRSSTSNSEPIVRSGQHIRKWHIPICINAEAAKRAMACMNQHF